MPPPTRAEIVADVTSPTFDVEVWTGAAWASVASHVIRASARLEAGGGEASGVAMGPAVSPEATVELAAAGWVQATDRTPVRIAFGFAASDKMLRFGGIVTSRGRGATSGQWQMRGWDAHIEAQEVRSPLFRRRPIATETTATSVEDTASSAYAGGLINYILWQCGGRPWEQAASYLSAVFYYRSTTALIGPEHTWIPGDNPWQVARRLCRAAGGQLYQDGEGTVCYVDPITLATGAITFTFTDEVLTQAQRAAQGKAGYQDIRVEIDSTVAITGVTAAYVSRLVQGAQTVYEDKIPRQIAAGAPLVVTCDAQLPLYALGGASIDAAVIRTATKASASQVTVSASLHSAQRVLVTITNTLSDPVMIDAVRVTGRPVSAGEEGSASAITSGARVVTAEDSPYLQSERHAAMLCRMLLDAGAAGGILYRLTGCGYDPDLAVGAIVGLTSADLSLTALRCRVVRVETADGAWMDVTLAPLGSLPTRDSVHIIGAISSTRDLAY